MWLASACETPPIMSLACSHMSCAPRSSRVSAWATNFIKQRPGVGDERLGVVEHDVFADLDGDARLLGLGLGEADDRDLRTAVDAARHDGHGCVIFSSVEQVDAGDALRGRHMGELNFGRDVADGVDVGDARLVALVHGDAAAVHLDRNAIREQAVAVRAAADGAEHGLAGDGLALFLAGEVDGDILTRVFSTLWTIAFVKTLTPCFLRMSARLWPSSLSMLGSRRSMPSMTVTSQPRSA